MKKYVFNIHKNSFSTYLKPIREKYSLIMLLLSSIEKMLITCPVEEEILDNFPYIILVKGKFSRLFFLSDHKIFSLSFPFNYDPPKDDNDIGRCYFNDINVDFGVISRVREFIVKLSETFNIYSSDSIEEVIDGIDIKESEDFYMVLTGLLTMEDGYIRYDHDSKHENGNLHPLHHYDIFYHSNNTFKIGIHEKCEFQNILNLLDNSMGRHYLTNK